jgi:CelD/BcsL family acetyltransferase involved in cellulose biosynthesis
LFARCPDATPFQSPAWLLPWWEVFGQHDPWVIAARRDGLLIGLGLFYLYEGDPARPAQLFFVGKSVSDYLDILVAPEEDRSQIAQQMFDCIFDFSSWWHAELDRLRPQSPVLQISVRPGIAERRFQEGICPEMPLKGSNIKQMVTKNTRDSIRKHRNRARSWGSVEFLTADETTFPRLFQYLIQFHSEHWQAAGEPGVFSDPNMVRFVREAGIQLLRSQLLQMHAMLLNDAPVAVAFGMLHRQREYFYMCDFNPEFVSISPGTLVTAYAMEQAAQRGAKHFDFLQGDEPYKFQKWGARPRYTSRVQFFRNFQDGECRT